MWFCEISLKYQVHFGLIVFIVTEPEYSNKKMFYRHWPDLLVASVLAYTKNHGLNNGIMEYVCPCLAGNMLPSSSSLMELFDVPVYYLAQICRGRKQFSSIYHFYTNNAMSIKLSAHW